MCPETLLAMSSFTYTSQLPAVSCCYAASFDWQKVSLDVSSAVCEQPTYVMGGVNILG